ncbi:hypothetical protein ACFFWA_16845 [Actinomadura verrucosospora]|uniref:hypothetical protein n=1 Tax=Actinomadura verrucosospora TaxID=46165 RepID=UPI0031E55A62
MAESGEESPLGTSGLPEQERRRMVDGQNLHVLTVRTVKAGISALKAQLIHEHFPAYLHLRKLAVTSGSLTDLHPDWKDVSDLLKMPGGPPTKPHYRPFSSVNRKDESGYWYNKNLAGSYAPRSMRVTSRFMLTADGNNYELPSDHVHEAFTRLLKEKRIPAWALAVYYLRNYGFIFEGKGGYDELISAFRKELAFEQGTDFNVLFEDIEPQQLSGDWFEPFDPSASDANASNKRGSNG